MVASIILVQSLLIVWLSSWAIGDYSNNQYVRAYVDSTTQSLIWIFGAFIIVGLLGSVLGLFVRKRHGSSLELVGISPKVPVTTPAARSAKSVLRASGLVSRTSPASGPSVTTVSATGVEVSGPKPAVELHPAVAALKAELSEARLSLGLASVTTGPQMPTGPVVRFEDQRGPPPAHPSPPAVPLQGAPARQQNAVMGLSQPPTVFRPMTSQGSNQNLAQIQGHRPSPPPTVIRPMLLGVGVTAQQSASQALRPSGSSSQPAPHPVGVPARSDEGPSTPRDVSTVITGIMPVLKKKDESVSSSDQNSQQQ